MFKCNALHLQGIHNPFCPQGLIWYLHGAFFQSHTWGAFFLGTHMHAQEISPLLCFHPDQNKNSHVGWGGEEEKSPVERERTMHACTDAHLTGNRAGSVVQFPTSCRLVLVCRPGVGIPWFKGLFERQVIYRPLFFFAVSSHVTVLNMLPWWPFRAATECIISLSDDAQTWCLSSVFNIFFLPSKSGLSGTFCLSSEITEIYHSPRY